MVHVQSLEGSPVRAERNTQLGTRARRGKLKSEDEKLKRRNESRIEHRRVN
jgi:hypothetical protein